MELKYFRCSKCFDFYVGKSDGPIQCGARVGWVIRDGGEVPLGCGGIMKEITKEEAEEAVYNSRSNYE